MHMLNVFAFIALNHRAHEAQTPDSSRQAATKQNMFKSNCLSVYL